MLKMKFYRSFSSSQSEQEILPSQDRLKSVHTEIILIEFEVRLSRKMEVFWIKYAGRSI